MAALEIDTYEQLKISGQLPSPRGVALAIIRLTGQADVSIAEIGRVISGDPAFAGRLIRAANGLTSVNRRSVVSASEALMILGLRAVRTMVLGFSLLSDFRKGACRSFDYDGYWAHSIALAVSMQVGAQRLRVAAADEMFSLGLLVRIGELALATAYPDEYARVLEETLELTPEARMAVEKGTFAITHSELGMAMLTDWGLPRIFVTMAGRFDDPAPPLPEPDSRLHRLTAHQDVSRAMAALCVSPPATRGARLREVLTAGAKADISPSDLMADCERALRLWLDWGEVLGLAMPPRFSVTSLMESILAETDSASVSDASVAVEKHASLEGAFVSEALGASENRAGFPAQARPEQAIATGTPSVLVIDDQPARRAHVVECVERNGVSTRAVADVRAGLEHVLDLQPEMIVLSQCSDDKYHLELLTSLRRIRIGKSIYVLMLCPDSSEDALIEAFDAGADDVMPGASGGRLLVARVAAGLRVISLQREVKDEREELRRYAAELAVTNRRLTEAAITDFLTGFKNRRYADERIGQAWLSAKRDDAPLSFMVIDFDGLKTINDMHGHAIGDLAIKRVAAAMQSQLRRQEVICRIGGDEFLVICPNADLAESLVCAERLRRSVSLASLVVEGEKIPLSVSIGVARLDTTMLEPDALFRLADRSAYLAKSRGRDQVVAIQQEDYLSDKNAGS